MVRRHELEPLTPEALADVERVLASACGIALMPGQRRALGWAVKDAALALGASAEELHARMQRGEEGAILALVERAVVGETCFWRHPAQLEALRELLPALSAGAPLSIWSAGCASGEEPYSLAILLAELGRSGDRVLATDVSAEALAEGRAGRYGDWSLRRLSQDRRERWLRASGGGVEVAPALREVVEFRRHNLVKDAAPGSFDVVVCRNVVIHFARETAAHVLEGLLRAVRPGGVLVLGPVELALGTSLAAQRLRRSGATLLRRPAAGALQTSAAATAAAGKAR